MPEPQDNSPEALDVDWEQENLAKLYRAGAVRGINPRRKERIEEDIRFDDFIGEVLGEGRLGEFINCPFHGSDATPSFRIYIDHGWCFGCPPKKQYYDHIRFVKEHQGISWIQALIWIEKKYNLEVLPGVSSEEDEETEPEVRVEFAELQEPFIGKAGRDVAAAKDWELAMEYHTIYFDGVCLMEDAKEWRKTDPDEAEKMIVKATIGLAKIVGQEAIDKLLLQKLEGKDAM
jgi:CHC2 zinc finger